jgi:ABC-2 type transport system ATP-binding protein
MIHVENLSRYYQDLCAVNGISFSIQKGEIVGLLGPNGAGKTTTLRMLTGFLMPSSGRIQVKDFTVGENTLAIKKLMGYLPESAPLYHDMLVYDYLAYIADIRGLEPALKSSRISEMVHLCGLNTVMHKSISELSKGFRQRVGLAHAMIGDPEILILDEPTSGLDPNQIVEIREIIKQIGQKKTVVLSTHILSEAEATCDRIMIIHQGKIVADGSTESIKQSAGGKPMLMLTLEQADFQAVQTRLSAVSGVSEITQIPTPDSEVLHLKLTCASDSTRRDVYQAIRQTDWMLMEFRSETQTLETIFRELTLEN